MLHQTIHLDNETQILIWKTSESHDELLLHLNLESQQLRELDSVHSVKRQMERLATLCLLEEAFPDGYKLEYTNEGKPLLRDSGKYISISHTAHWVVLAVSERNIGIDIQQIDSRVNKIRQRFVRAEEYIDPAHETLHLLLHWSAKEAAYKWLGLSAVDLKKHLQVLPFQIEDSGEFEIKETKTKEENLLCARYEITSDFVLVTVG